MYQQHPENGVELSEEIAELESIRRSSPSLSTVRRKFPSVWAALVLEHEPDDTCTQEQQCETLQAWLEQHYGGLAEWCQDRALSNNKLLRIMQAVETVQAAMAMPVQADVLSRYQAALDNELYKSLRALRDAQKHRLEQAALNATPV